MTKKNEYKIRTSFTIVGTELYLVEVVGWSNKDYYCELEDKVVEGRDWKWNVYAYIYDNNSLYENCGELSKAPFSGGITLALQETSEPLGGVKYSWQKESKFIRVGSDYSHIWDSCTRHLSPFDGIPPHIERDAILLSEWLGKHSSEI